MSLLNSREGYKRWLPLFMVLIFKKKVRRISRAGYFAESVVV